ncbi:STAS domain-containing protein [Fundidesulfovibrio agrisoli]|uniref:STAS domain-containing protein n=1 Tax=Fundidesulfovibrio agrisoli TaxID=2922717 RepID=UPI001FAB5471|nr:STAS domain-containing protein [Fundidesulfovibrio agrisoli]
MEFAVTNAGPVTVLAIAGRLDSNTSKELEDKVMGLITGGAQLLLMDFGGVDYINSSGLRVLLMAFQHLKKSGGLLHLCDIKDYMREVFEISGYNEIFPIFPGQAEALAAFPG